MSSATDTDVPRHPGRPRSVEADRAILRAALDLLAEEGFGGVTMEGVAGRAGCGKTTIYRRWASKSALVVDAITACKEDGHPIPNTGSIRGDLRAYARATVATMRTSDLGRILPAMVAEMARNPELAEAFRERLVRTRRSRVLEMLGRGVARGEVRADVDLDLVADALVGVFFHRLLVSGLPIDDGAADRLADLLLRGVAACAG